MVSQTQFYHHRLHDLNCESHLIWHELNCKKNRWPVTSTYQNFWYELCILMNLAFEKPCWVFFFFFFFVVHTLTSHPTLNVQPTHSISSSKCVQLSGSTLFTRPIELKRSAFSSYWSFRRPKCNSVQQTFHFPFINLSILAFFSSFLYSSS